jgi:hypothetical protein
MKSSDSLKMIARLSDRWRRAEEEVDNEFHRAKKSIPNDDKLIRSQRAPPVIRLQQRDREPGEQCAGRLCEIADELVPSEDGRYGVESRDTLGQAALLDREEWTNLAARRTDDADHTGDEQTDEVALKCIHRTGEDLQQRANQ